MIEVKTASMDFPKKCYDTFSSFSNKYGGIIIFGINVEKGDVIENRHSGIPTMIREMKKYGLPKPEFYEERDSFKVIFKNKNVIINKQSDTQSDTQKTHLEIEKKVLDFCIEPKSAQEIRAYLNISSKRYVAYQIIRPLINSGKLDYTNKNSINARNQKYLTVKKN